MKVEICKNCRKTKEEHDLEYNMNGKKLYSCDTHGLDYFEPITNHSPTEQSNEALRKKSVEGKININSAPEEFCLEDEIELVQRTDDVGKTEMFLKRDIKTAIKLLKERLQDEGIHQRKPISVIKFNEIYKEIFGGLADE